MKPFSQAWSAFLLGIGLLLTSSALSTLRNPRGIPDNSPWSYVDLFPVVLGFAFCMAAPLFTPRNLKSKIALSLGAAASYVGVVIALAALHFFVFGLPVQS